VERRGEERRVFKSQDAFYLTSSTTGRGAVGVLWAALHSLAVRMGRRAGHLAEGKNGRSSKIAGQNNDKKMQYVLEEMNVFRKVLKRIVNSSSALDT
jgi:hypothetical protein